MWLSGSAQSRWLIIRASVAGLLAAALCLAPGAGPAASSCVPAAFKVAIDVGHDRASFGATSARGVPEFAFNRAVAERLLRSLRESGFTSTVLLNPSGGSIALRRRTALANAEQADLLVSIHHDSVQPRYLADWTFEGRRLHYSDRFSGFSLFYSEKNPQAARSRLFAELLGSELLNAALQPSHHHAEPIPGEGRELVDPQQGVYRFDELVVLKSAAMPAVLLECGIIVNRQEEARLRTAAFQDLLVSAAVRAIERFCALPAR